MTPVTQSKLYGRDGYGTCWTACLASVLDLPERAVPHFANPALFSEPGEGDLQTDLEAFVNADRRICYWTASMGWLLMLGYRLWEVDPTDPSRPLDDEHLIAGGLSPRSPVADGDNDEVHHAVVYGRQPDGTYALAHDPHPDGGGLVGEPHRFYAVRPAFSPAPND